MTAVITGRPPKTIPIVDLALAQRRVESAKAAFTKHAILATKGLAKPSEVDAALVELWAALGALENRT
ncbi:MAG TPA: hypothetical protein VJT81_00400 [Burkholderiales bacterium]|nr:hypothetical protein [Burkholderiales bacterium]